jgi:hypothetical protein
MCVHPWSHHCSPVMSLGSMPFKHFISSALSFLPSLLPQSTGKTSDHFLSLQIDILNVKLTFYFWNKTNVIIIYSISFIFLYLFTIFLHWWTRLGCNFLSILPLIILECQGCAGLRTWAGVFGVPLFCTLWRVHVRWVSFVPWSIWIESVTEIHIPWVFFLAGFFINSVLK